MGGVGWPEVTLPEAGLTEARLPEAGSQVESRQVSGSGVGVGQSLAWEREASANALAGFEKLV